MPICDSVRDTQSIESAFILFMADISGDIRDREKVVWQSEDISPNVIIQIYF